MNMNTSAAAESTRERDDPEGIVGSCRHPLMANLFHGAAPPTPAAGTVRPPGCPGCQAGGSGRRAVQAGNPAKGRPRPWAPGCSHRPVTRPSWRGQDLFKVVTQMARSGERPVRRAHRRCVRREEARGLRQDGGLDGRRIPLLAPAAPRDEPPGGPAARDIQHTSFMEPASTAASSLGSVSIQLAT